MNSDYRGILLIMKSAITRQPEVLPEGFDLEAQLELLKMHHMFPLIYDGAVRCGISQQEPFMQKLFQVYFKAIRKSDGQQRQVERIREAFRQANIDYMLLKGSRMKHLYPAPELRFMGDADILIRVEQYEKIVPVMEGLGFRYDYEMDHEIIWRHEELFLELHKHLIPSYNPDFYGYYGNGWQLAVKGEGSEHTMKPEDEWIFLFTHFAKHYRDGGAGCRYVADLWLWRRNYPHMDERYILEVLKKMQLDVFYGHILRLLDYWFEDGAGDETLDIITEFIFFSGSWGADKLRALSQTLRDTKHSLLGSSGRLVYLWKMAFPGVKALRNKYRILYKAPWLLPVVWLVRFFYKLFFETGSAVEKVTKAKDLTQENLRLRQEMLNLVGLDYHF